MAIPFVGFALKLGLGVASEVGSTVLAAAMRAFTGKFFLKMAIKYLDGYVKRTETKWDDKVWPDFKAALEVEIGDNNASKEE